MDNFDYLAQFEFEGEMGLFDEYLAVMEKFLEVEAQKHTESIKTIRRSGQVNFREDGPPPEEEYDRFKLGMLDQFTDILRRSFFVNLYAFFESQLVNECRNRKSSETPLSFSDIAGQNDIDRAKTYFTKVLRIQFPSDTFEWQEIQNYRLLRNCIVHNQGKVDEGVRDQKLRDYIARKKSLSVYGNEVNLDKGFCEEAFQIIEKFLLLVLFPNKADAR